MPLSNHDKTTSSDRPECVVTSETTGDHAEVTTDNELKVFQEKAIEIEFDPLQNVTDEKSYVFSWFGTLGNNAAKEYILTAPDTLTRCYLGYKVTLTTTTEIYFYENPTTTLGALQTSYNRDRNSSNTSEMTIHDAGTISSDGTLLFSEKAGSSAGKIGKSGSEDVFILKQNEQYLFRVASKVANNFITIAIDWFEEPGA